MIIQYVFMRKVVVMSLRNSLYEAPPSGESGQIVRSGIFDIAIIDVV